MMSEEPVPPESTQMRLFALAEVEPTFRVDPLAGWTLTDARALAIDPDPDVRRTAAMSAWTVDARLQATLASDPCEEVVLTLLDRVDLGIDAVLAVLNGPHPLPRRQLADRNLPCMLLLEMTGDRDPEVASLAARSLRIRHLGFDPSGASR